MCVWFRLVARLWADQKVVGVRKDARNRCICYRHLVEHEVVTFRQTCCEQKLGSLTRSFSVYGKVVNMFMLCTTTCIVHTMGCCIMGVFMCCLELLNKYSGPWSGADLDMFKYVVSSQLSVVVDIYSVLGRVVGVPF